MIPDEALLNIVFLCKAANYPALHLIKSKPVLADKDMTLAALVTSGVEADYPGYAAASLTTWSSPSITSPDDGVINCTEQTFQPSGMSSPQTIYGYWVTMKDRSSTDVLWIFKRFSTPLVMLNDSSQIKITVYVYDKDFSPP